MASDANKIGATQLPREWSWIRLKFLRSIPLAYGANEAAESTDPAMPRFIRITDIDENGALRGETFRSLPMEVAKPYLLEDEDILLARSGATVGKAIRYRESWGAACFAGYLIRLRLNRGRLMPVFFSYYTQSAIYEEEIRLATIQATIQNVSGERYDNFLVPTPPLDMQHGIVRFLDRKTAAIDTLIVKKEQLVAALQEKRQAIITRALPNDNWPIWTVRNLIRARHLRVQDGNHGELHPTAVDYVDNGIPFLMASNVRAGQVDLAGCKFISMERAEQLRIGFAKPGDVLLTHKATLGEVAILPSLNAPYAMLTPQVTYYRPLTEMIDREYLMFVFNSEAFQEQLRFIGSLQSTRSYVSILAQRDLCIPIAPRTRQDEIVVDLQRRCNGLDHALRLTRESIVKLREYRQALITAAVTGQIDLTREEAA